ncbi:MAG: ATP-binding protein [Bacteroidota bacterium]|nr:ATP-binding protein [Bacteroidota bacterium]
MTKPVNKKYIARKKYVERIKPFINKDIIKILTGQRRVGKSYLMYQLMDYIEGTDKNANIIYINTELHEFDRLKNYEQLYNYIKEKSVQNTVNYVFVDEIQTVNEFENALKSLLAEGGYDLYCTGSNADLLSGELATNLAGRYVEFNVFPLSYKEFLEFHSLQNTSESMDRYMKYGGLPYLRNIPLQNDVVFDYLHNVYQSILFRDVVARYNIRNIEFLERLVLFLARQCGTLFSARNIVRFLKSQNIKTSVSTVLDYMHFLSRSFFISKVKRTDIQGKKTFEVGEKYYFTDIGLRNAIAGFSPLEIGQIIENIVFNHLKFNNYRVKVGQTGHKEVDFIGQKKNEKVYIQVALRITDENTQKREFGNLLEIDDNYPKLVVTLDDYTGTTYKGIKHIPLRIFLSTFE